MPRCMHGYIRGRYKGWSLYNRRVVTGQVGAVGGLRAKAHAWIYNGQTQGLVTVQLTTKFVSSTLSYSSYSSGN